MNTDTSADTPATTLTTPFSRPERHRRTEKEKAEYLTLFAESGLSAAAFCREMGLSDATFALWRRHQQSPQHVSEKAEIARVVFADDADDATDDDESVSRAARTSVSVKMPNGIETTVSGLDAAAILQVLTHLARHCSH